MMFQSLNNLIFINFLTNHWLFAFCHFKGTFSQKNLQRLSLKTTVEFRQKPRSAPVYFIFLKSPIQKLRIFKLYVLLYQMVSPDFNQYFSSSSDAYFSVS
jgi:hypothetical protein